MIVINTIDDNRFSVNGIAYLRRFISIVNGNSISIKNIYDSSIELVSDNYANFTVNGNTFASAALLQNALVTVLFNTTITPQGWQNLTLGNSWSNHYAGYAPASYFKDPNGMVVLRGLIKFGVDGIITNLPVGYRPQYIELFPSNPQSLNLSTNKTSLDVQPNGDVVIYGVSGNAYVSLSVIKFSTNAL